jgi:hypothetical protein
MHYRLDYITQALTFNVIQTTDCKVPLSLNRKNGFVYQQAQWTIKKAGEDLMLSGNLTTNDSALII